MRRFFEHVDRCEIALDIGAGGGADLALAHDRFPNATRHAIEVSAENGESLRQQGIIVHETNLERDALPFSDNSIDMIIANQIIEHIKEIFWVFHEVTRVLRPGGALLIGVPNLASMHNRLLLALGLQPTTIRATSAHVRGFTKSDLLHFVREIFPGGYRLAAFSGANFYPFPPALAVPLARAFPTLAVGLFFMLVKCGPYEEQFRTYPRSRRLETNFWTGEPERA